MHCPKGAISGVALLTRQEKFFSDDNAYVFSVVRYSRLRSTEDSRLKALKLLAAHLLGPDDKAVVKALCANELVKYDIFTLRTRGKRT